MSIVATEGFSGSVTADTAAARVAPGAYALAIDVRDAVVAYHEAVCSPRLLDDEAHIGATYGLLSDVTQLRLSIDEWTHRLLEDRINELRARLDLIAERLSERRWWWPWQRDGIAEVVDHRIGIAVVEVDVVVVDGSLAAASVVLVVGDEPFRLTDSCWWVREDGRWAATECPVGPAASAEFGFPEQAEGEGHRFVLTDGAGWEETRRT